MSKVGFIGLGIMGKPMAKNLINAGYSLVVFDVAEKPLEELAACDRVAGLSAVKRRRRLFGG